MTSASHERRKESRSGPTHLPWPRRQCYDHVVVSYVKAAARLLILALVAATWSATGPTTAAMRLAQHSASAERNRSSAGVTDAADLDGGATHSRLSSRPARSVVSQVAAKPRPSRSGTRRLVSEMTSGPTRVDLTWAWRLQVLHPDTRGVSLPSSIAPRGPPASLTHVI